MLTEPDSVCSIPNMATASPSDQLVFSPESLDFREEVRSRLWQRMTELATERVRAERRQRITEDDVKHALPRAVRDVLAEFGIPLAND